MGKTSRNKGKVGEREFASLCREHGWDCKRGVQYSGLGGDDVVGLPGIHIEVKRTETLSLYQAMAQSIADAKGNMPIVAHRRNHHGWLIVMRAEDWFEVYREFGQGQEIAN